MCLAGLLLAGCAGDDSKSPEAQNGVDQGGERRTVRDPVGDVTEDAELGGPVDQERADLQEVTISRSGKRLQVTFQTVEQPGEAKTQRLVAASPDGRHTAVIEAVFDDEPRRRGEYRTPSGERRPAKVEQRGNEVTVKVPLDEVTRAPKFRWRAAVVETRQSPEVADRLPDLSSEWLTFPAM